MVKINYTLLIFIFVGGLFLIGATFGAEKEKTVERKLEQLLKKYPKADLNGDGKLTETEARAYLKKAKTGNSTKQDQAADAIEPTENNVRYGPHERNVFDLYKADSKKPTPLLIYWHGGGFKGGDKSKLKQDLLAECLDAGISVVSGNYRLIDTAPFPAAMMDGARTIQFIRFHAKKFNIDPARIALSGSSAGANMSIWIAMKDDLAKGNSKDPIARQSTRVSCVVSMAGQTSNDPNFILTNIGGNSEKLHPSTLGFYGIESRDQLWSPAIKKKAYEASAINFATQDDPPLFLAYSGNLTPTPLPADTPEGARIHHPRFGELLKEKYDQLGGECHFYHKAVQAKPEARIDFLKKHLHR